MKNPFKKVDPKQTLQSIQQEFNQLIFKLGERSFHKTRLNQELTAVNNEVNTINQKIDKLNEEAGVLRKRIEEEMAAEIKKGQANAGSTSQSD